MSSSSALPSTRAIVSTTLHKPATTRSALASSFTLRAGNKQGASPRGQNTRHAERGERRTTDDDGDEPSTRIVPRSRHTPRAAGPLGHTDRWILNLRILRATKRGSARAPRGWGRAGGGERVARDPCAPLRASPRCAATRRPAGEAPPRSSVRCVRRVRVRADGRARGGAGARTGRRGAWRRSRRHPRRGAPRRCRSSRARPRAP